MAKSISAVNSSHAHPTRLSISEYPVIAVRDRIISWTSSRLLDNQPATAALRVSHSSVSAKVAVSIGIVWTRG